VLSGSEFRPAIGMAMVLSWSTSLLGVITTAEEVLRAHGDVRFPARAQVLGLGVNIALLVMLVPAIGAWGAVLASTVCYLVITAFVFRRVSATAHVHHADLRPRRADLRLIVDAIRGGAVRSSETVR
jgi:O-antigen/teichoic acid export membrane protein